ncbi:MAG: tubulin beta chain [Promethearchaeota archaeon]
MAREVIMIHVGQAGLQVGAKYWKNVCAEHNLDLNGAPIGGNYKGSPETFFMKASSGKFVPRAVLVDLEPKVIRSITNDVLPGFFDPKNMVNGLYGGANSFAKGYRGEGQEIVDQVMAQIRKEVEKTESLQGFIMTHAIGGGTGGGLASLIMEHIKEEFPKKILWTFSILPSPLLSDAVVEPYNAILSLDKLIQYADETVVIDNHALFQIVHKNMGIADPVYDDLNNVISQALSDITASLRFKGSLNTDMKEFLVNLVPYPRSHFLMASYAPMATAEDRQYAKLTTSNLASALFEENYMMAAVDVTKGTFLACSLLFRGENTAKDITNSMLDIKGRIKFSSFIPTGIKYGMTDTAPEGLERSGSALINHTGVSEIFNRILAQFNLMYNKGAFLTWYESEGMTKDDFNAARDNVQKLSDEYKRDDE